MDGSFLILPFKKLRKWDIYIIRRGITNFQQIMKINGWDIVIDQAMPIAVTSQFLIGWLDIFIGLRMAHFSFHNHDNSKNLYSGKSIYIEGLYKFSLKLRNKRPWYRDIQTDAWCTDIVIFDRLRPKKNICLFPICCHFNQWVGREFILFFILFFVTSTNL